MKFGKLTLLLLVLFLMNIMISACGKESSKKSVRITGASSKNGLKAPDAQSATNSANTTTATHNGPNDPTVVDPTAVDAEKSQAEPETCKPVLKPDQSLSCEVNRTDSTQTLGTQVFKANRTIVTTEKLNDASGYKIKVRFVQTQEAFELTDDTKCSSLVKGDRVLEAQFSVQLKLKTAVISIDELTEDVDRKGLSLTLKPEMTVNVGTIDTKGSFVKAITLDEAESSESVQKLDLNLKTMKFSINKNQDLVLDKKTFALTLDILNEKKSIDVILNSSIQSEPVASICAVKTAESK